MTSYRVCVVYDTSIGTGCPNNGTQFNKLDFGARRVFISLTAALITQYSLDD